MDITPDIWGRDLALHRRLRAAGRVVPRAMACYEH
jgi:hypothetical protein